MPGNCNKCFVLILYGLANINMVSVCFKGEILILLWFRTKKKQKKELVSTASRRLTVDAENKFRSFILTVGNMMVLNLPVECRLFKEDAECNLRR